MIIGVQNTYNFEKEVGIMKMEGKAGWHVSVETMKHRGDFSFPVLQYRWGMKDGLTGGFVRIWPSVVRIEVKSQGEKRMWLLDTISNTLAVIKSEFTDEIPPSIKEAFDVMIELKRAENIVDAESAQKVFDGIKSKWEEMISSAEAR